MIPEQAFSYCMNLTSVSLPEGIVYIGKNSFENCVSLTSVIFPSTLACVDENAFDRCIRLETVVWFGTASQWEKLSVNAGNRLILSAKKVQPGDEITVSFDANGGAGQMSGMNLTSGSAVVLPECGFTPPDGGTFQTWTVNGQKFAPGEEVILHSDIVAVALWDV